MHRIVLALLAVSMVTPASATLLLYEPFDYTAGASLGGAGGSPVGLTNANTGGGTWHARGTAGGHVPANDAAVGAGSMSYAGLLPGVGNSVSYGSAAGSTALYADSIDIPGADVTSGALYASFIIRIKSGLGTGARHSPVGFVSDSTPPGTLGSDLAGQVGGAVNMPSSFFMRSDPTVATVTNFSPSKTNSDGIGPGATGPSAGYQHSQLGTNVETNQFGDRDGQAQVNNADPNTYQTYFVVLKYTFDQMSPAVNGQNDTVSLWMNPGSGTLGRNAGEADASQAPTGDLGSYYAAVNAFGTGATTDSTLISSFALIGHRQNLATSIAMDFDELRIGTTWADVTPAIPESSHVMAVAALATVVGYAIRKKLVARQPQVA